MFWCSISGIVSDADLRNLINELDEKGEENLQWNNVVDKRNSSVTYSVKNCKPKVCDTVFYLS